MSGRINFHTLAADPRQQFERTFTDPGHPDEELLLKFESRDVLTDYVAAEVSIELARRYIEGNPELGMAAQPFVVDGEQKPLSPLLCDDVGRIVALQPENWPERFQPEEILMMAFKRFGFWIQVRRWSREIYMAAEGALPNGLGRPEASSSVPPSNGEPSTPPSLTISAGRSGASTSGSRVVTGSVSPSGATPT